MACPTESVGSIDGAGTRYVLIGPAVAEYDVALTAEVDPPVVTVFVTVAVAEPQPATRSATSASFRTGRR